MQNNATVNAPKVVNPTKPQAVPAPAAQAAPAPKAKGKPFTLEAAAEAVAKLGKDLRSSSTASRARVDHASHRRLVVGFAWAGGSLLVSCPFWEKHGVTPDEKGSYLIKKFPLTTPLNDVVKAVGVVLKKEGLI